MKTSLLPLLALPIATVALLSEARAVDLDFSSSSQYTDNFERTQLTTGSGGAFGFANNRLEHTSTGSGSTVFVYDTAPGSAPSNLFTNVNVGFDFSAATTNVSFGVYFGGSSRTNANLALFNINFNGIDANDTIRFFSGGSMTTANAGTQWTTSISNVVGGTLADGTVTSDTGAWTTGTTYHASLSINYITATTADVTFTITNTSNSTSISATASGISVAEAGGEIGFRSSFSAGGSGLNAFDNISISNVPEPASVAFLGGLGALGFAAIRRRRR